MKINRGPVALVVLALAAELAYIAIKGSKEVAIIIVSHGDLLSIWNAMYLGLEVESYYRVDIHGPAGGVSHMSVGDDGKHRVRHINDMSYIES